MGNMKGKLFFAAGVLVVIALVNRIGALKPVKDAVYGA